jgi:hypothetical protein
MAPLLGYLPSQFNIGDGKAFLDLMPGSMSKFNLTTRNDPAVSYFSISAVLDPQFFCCAWQVL